MKYDFDKLTRLISELNNSLSLLKDVSIMDLNRFQRDPHRVSSAKYNFIVAIESVIDICNHLISKNGYRVPEDYADTFRVMAENNILSENFTDTLIKMAKFRNRLVHLYWKVDTEIIFSILQNNMGDFDEFLSKLNEFINE
ncbi:MAG: DUF86 domain-containing protein [Firmicutes bacterium HGW-Firmicutes-13]|nr:MAG: DUF86 domain-containing protein [Firmicutes bacterium HGW-Firmicutes-13]